MKRYRFSLSITMLFALVLLSACDSVVPFTDEAGQVILSDEQPIEVVLTAAEETRVDSRTPNQNYDGSELLVVNYAGGWTERSYVRFDLSSIPHNATVLEARIELFYHLCDGIDSIAVYPAARPWDASTLTWANQPGPATPISSGPSSPPSPHDVVNLGPDFPQTFNCGDTGEYVAAPGGSASKPGWFITKLAQNWIDGSAANRGVVFMAYPEYDNPNPPGRLLAVFGSSEATPQFPAMPPRLRVTYTN